MLDFLRPGKDGVIPAENQMWQRGMVYTARPAIPSPMVPGREYRITTSFKRRITKDEKFKGYEKLYGRISRLAELRISQLRCIRDDPRIHSWIIGQWWAAMEAPYHFATAVLTMGVISQKTGDSLPSGEERPTSQSLAAPSSNLHEAANRVNSQPADEIYHEFDFTEPGHNGQLPCPVILSYGDRIRSREGLNFEPFVRSAEIMAAVYAEFSANESGAERANFQLLGREWFSVSDPDLVVIHVFFQGPEGNACLHE